MSAEDYEQLRGNGGAAIGEDVEENPRSRRTRVAWDRAPAGNLCFRARDHAAFSQGVENHGRGGLDGVTLLGVAAYDDGNIGLDEEYAGAWGDFSVEGGVFGNVLAGGTEPRAEDDEVPAGLLFGGEKRGTGPDFEEAVQSH